MFLGITLGVTAIYISSIRWRQGETPEYKGRYRQKLENGCHTYEDYSVICTDYF